MNQIVKETNQGSQEKFSPPSSNSKFTTETESRPLECLSFNKIAEYS